MKLKPISILYIIVAIVTFGASSARTARNTTEDMSSITNAVTGGLACGLFWPLYWAYRIAL